MSVFPLTGCGMCGFDIRSSLLFTVHRGRCRYAAVVVRETEDNINAADTATGTRSRVLARDLLGHQLLLYKKGLC